MDNNKGSKMDKDYDWQNDSLLLYVSNDYKYKESIELGKNIILDFDENYVPVALEILNASKELNVEKFQLKSGFDLDMEIGITEEMIVINAAFKVFFHQKPINAPINAEIPNNMNLPNVQTHFAVGSV